MKRKELLSIFLLSLTMFFISFVLGYQLMGRQIEKNDYSKLNSSNVGMEDELDLEILLDGNIITPNTIMERRINYTACNHVVTKVDDVEAELVNMSKEDLLEYLEVNYPNVKLISFSSNKITLGLNKNHLCENHYVIGEQNGYIAIFKIGENGERILRTVFEDNPISLLMEVDQEKIQKGIVVDTEDELTEILENFIS